MTKVLEDAPWRTNWPQKDRKTRKNVCAFWLDVERRHGSEAVLNDEDWKLIEERRRAATRLARFAERERIFNYLAARYPQASRG